MKETLKDNKGFATRDFASMFSIFISHNQDHMAIRKFAALVQYSRSSGKPTRKSTIRFKFQFNLTQWLSSTGVYEKKKEKSVLTGTLGKKSGRNEALSFTSI
jgi:hypothetical protein